MCLCLRTRQQTYYEILPNDYKHEDVTNDYYMKTSQKHTTSLQNV